MLKASKKPWQPSVPTTRNKKYGDVFLFFSSGGARVDRRVLCVNHARAVPDSLVKGPRRCESVVHPHADYSFPSSAMADETE